MSFVIHVFQIAPSFFVFLLVSALRDNYDKNLYLLTTNYKTRKRILIDGMKVKSL